MFGIPAVIGVVKWIAGIAVKSGVTIPVPPSASHPTIVEIPGLEQLGCQVFGSLKFSDNAAYLVGNMIEARFASGLWVVAGWFHEHSSQGAYRVSVIDEHAGRVLTVRKQRMTHDVNEAARIFSQYAHEVARGIVK